jgi:hypothetical protein
MRYDHRTMINTLRRFAPGLVLAITTMFAPAAIADTAPAKAPTTTKAPAKDAAKPAPVKAELVDINSATEEQLAALPGVGEAYSKKIVAGRPYAKKDQLVSKKIVPASAYKKFSAKIVAKKPEGAASTETKTPAKTTATKTASKTTTTKTDTTKK